jgi:RNA polymerase sigma-54 factor
MYRRRKVVNDVYLRLQQGEIVGLLGPNGAGKTTTFYMIVGSSSRWPARSCSTARTSPTMPMYQRARRGDRLPVAGAVHLPEAERRGELLAILETLPIPSPSGGRLERLLDELGLKHLRHSKAYSLSGGERRRLEITRALVTEPKFMMLDEPFAGVDPIAVHDIQTIVAGLRHRGIGVLISDHNVEQTLDIVDRAYIMFDGQVKVSGTVRDLVFDDTVAEIYLGPTLTARLRARFAAAERVEHARVKPGLNQSTQLRQEMKINPRLYQAMDLLYMPLLDLQQHLKQELLNNPFLELVEDDEDDDETSEPRRAERNRRGSRRSREEEREGIDWEEILLDGFDAGGHREEHEEREYYEPVTVDTRDLSDHLRDQVQLLELNPRQLVLADEFIGNINDDGYLTARFRRSSIPSTTSCPNRRGSGTGGRGPSPVHAGGRRGDAGHRAGTGPCRVAARDLRECLMLQLKDAGLEQSVPFRLVRDCFEELIAHRWSEISKRFGISPADVQGAADEIAKLDPKPGLRYSSGGDNYIIPTSSSRRSTEISRLSQRRQSAAAQAEQGVPGDRARQEEVRRREQGVHLQQAQLRQLDDPGDRAAAADDAQGDELHRRAAARLLREGRAVPQAAHAARGRRSDQHARVHGQPRHQREVRADAARRAAAQVLLLVRLSTTEGEDVSARGIKAQLQKLVAEEDPRHPLTDQAIVNILKQNGVQIARRTVAKYRDQLGVLSARMRKRV